MNVSVNSTLLTLEARSCPQAHVTRKARPNKHGRDQSSRGLDTMVRDIMEQVEELMLEL